MSEIVRPRATALRVVAAMWRARGPQVARLLDVTDGADGDVRLIVDDGVVPLRRMLASGISLGEAVTLLAPLAECVEAIAAAGVLHGGIDVDAIGLSEDGAPVLAGFERAPASASPVLGGADPPGADRAGFRALARRVLEAVPEGAAREEALIEVDRTPMADHGDLGRFAERLLELADPEPLRMDRRDLPGRIASVPRERGRDGLPDSTSTPPSRAVRGVIARARAMRSGLGGVRPRYWVLAGIVAAALGGSLLLLGEAPDAEGTSAPDPVALRSTRHPPVPTATAAPTSTPSAASDAADDPPGDPIEALRRLRPGTGAARVVDDYGDVVLLSVDDDRGGTSVLLERTEEGWRLRDASPEPPAE